MWENDLFGNILAESWHLFNDKDRSYYLQLMVLGGALDNWLWFLLPEEFFADLMNTSIGFYVQHEDNFWLLFLTLKNNCQFWRFTSKLSWSSVLQMPDHLVHWDQ